METEVVDEEEKLNDEEEQMDPTDKFLNNLSSTLFVKRDYDMKEFNYEWVDKLEDVIPYIDNILRNPKRFIINDEEIVKVELAKRVTVESVIHLSQHTNLIQKIEDNGDVKPSKILNINREESMDTYENRFIFTLINNTRQFYEDRISATAGNSYCIDKNIMRYEAITKVDADDLKISIDLSDISKIVKETGGEKNHISLKDRLYKIKVQLDGFTGTELWQTLNRLHVAPVRSPIRKTNVILKNPNFRKAEELWNYIQSFESKDKKEKDKRDYFDRGILKNEYDQAFLMAFIANKNLINTSLDASETVIVNQMMKRLIDNLLDSSEELDEDKIKMLFDKQLSNIKEKNEKRSNSIFRIIDRGFDKELENYYHIINILGKEA